MSWNNDLVENGWKLERYNVVTKNGPEPAEGMVKHGVSVRESCAIEYKKHHEFLYTVEHVKTGRKIESFDQKWKAFNFAQAIVDLPNFEQFKYVTDESIPEPLLAELKKLRDQFHEG